MSSSIFVLAPSEAAGLSCAPDEDDISFEQMIDQKTTAEARYPIMILGVVRSVKDLGGDADDGPSIARLEVVEHPVGYAPAESRVGFWRESHPSTLYRFQFRLGGRYVVIAHRNDDGSFRSDGTCGQTKRMTHERFRELVRYARSH